jgi:hypothetical protein
MENRGSGAVEKVSFIPLTSFLSPMGRGGLLKKFP